MAASPVVVSIHDPLPDIDSLVLDKNELIEANQISHPFTSHLKDEAEIKNIEGMTLRMMKVKQYIFRLLDAGKALVDVAMWRGLLARMWEWLFHRVPAHITNTVYQTGVYFNRIFRIVIALGKNRFGVYSPLHKPINVDVEELQTIVRPGDLVPEDNSLGKPSGVVAHPIFAKSGYTLSQTLENVPRAVVESAFPRDKRYRQFTDWVITMASQYPSELEGLLKDRRITHNYITEFNAILVATKSPSVIASVTAGQSTDKGPEGDRVNRDRKSTLIQFPT